MKKEEILRKEQTERSREYEEPADFRISKQGVLFLALLCALFWLVKVAHADLTGLEEVHTEEFPAILMGYAAFVDLRTFQMLKNRRYLFSGLLFAVCFLISFLQYLRSL